MNESAPQPDPLDELLAVPQQPGDERLRGSLLDQTQRLLRSGRRRQRFTHAAALAACYLAGILTMRLWPLSPAAFRPNDVPAASNTDAVAAVSQPEEPLPPAVLERLGETADREERARLFRLAGSRYEESGDLQGATRCYALFLDVGSKQDLEVSAVDDSWLLMALKADRQKEKADENTVQ